MKKKSVYAVVAVTLSLVANTAYADYTIQHGSSDYSSVEVSNGNNTWQQAAAPFTTSGAGVITNVTLGAYQYGSPVDNLRWYIVGDLAGEPDFTNVIGNSGDLAITGDDSVCTTVNPNFSSLALSASTDYWLVQVRTGSLDDTAAYGVCGANGVNHSLLSGTTWTDVTTQDFDMDIQTGIPPPTPTTGSSTQVTTAEAVVWSMLPVIAILSFALIFALFIIV